MFSLNVGDEISLQVALERAALLCARVLIAVVDAAVLRQLVPRVEAFVAYRTVESFGDAQVNCLVLLKQKVEMKLFIAVVAVILWIVLRVIDTMIVQCRLGFVAFIAISASERSYIVRVLVPNVIHKRLL